MSKKTEVRRAVDSPIPGRYEKVVVQEQVFPLNRRRLEEQKKSLEASLKEVKEDLAQLDKLEKEDKKTDSEEKTTDAEVE
jgi:hypothetical protein